MYINSGSVKIELDFNECWTIGVGMISDLTSDYHLKHWSSFSYESFLDNNKKQIELAKQFCKFTNDTWVEHQLSKFKDKLEKEIRKKEKK